MNCSRSPTGSGPGCIAPDGSAVEFYSLLTADDEPEVVRAAIGDRGSILELGCGAGRVTHALVSRGYEVVAVDESAEMLARLRDVRRVRARIENLELDRRFDCVMLASYLVNTSESATRAALLAACGRHVRENGRVLIQWHPAEVQDAWVAGTRRARDGVTITLATLRRSAAGQIAATMRYEVGGQVWTQSFTSSRLTDDDLAVELSRAGLVLDRFITDNRVWLSARPVT